MPIAVAVRLCGRRISPQCLRKLRRRLWAQACGISAIEPPALGKWHSMTRLSISNKYVACCIGALLCIPPFARAGNWVDIVGTNKVGQDVIVNFEGSGDGHAVIMVRKGWRNQELRGSTLREAGQCVGSGSHEGVRKDWTRRV